MNLLLDFLMMMIRLMKRFPFKFLLPSITSRYRRREQWLASTSRSLPASDLGVRSILNGWVGTKLDELPPQSKKYLDSYHRKMNPHHEAMVRLDYHGAQ